MSFLAQEWARREKMRIQIERSHVRREFFKAVLFGVLTSSLFLFLIV